MINTPGPWAFDAVTGAIYYNDAADIRPVVATVDLDNVMDPVQGEGDGLLLAAAPEMRDRLHLWRNWAECAEPADQVPPQLYAATLETLAKANPEMDWADGEAFDRLSRVRNEAPALLAALRKAQELLRELEAPAHLEEGAALDDKIAAILFRIDGTPTAQPAESFAHAPEACPSQHHNRGDDICADCGADLNGEGLTDEPAPPTKGIAETVAIGLWRAMAVKEIAARKAPKKFGPELAGIKWAALSVACELRGLDPEFDRAVFMAAAGYPGEF